jgi:hypothetical protein
MKTTNSSFEETFALDSNMFTDKYAIRELSGGYMVCQPRVARTGIQVYLGAEVGRPDLKQVRVYRPETEVMHRDSVFSLAGKPVTIEHPSEPVTAENWRDKAVGYVGDEILRDGEFIRVPLHLMDAAAVKEVKGGRSQLSVGYTANLQWGDGVTPTGEAYDVMQTTIRANHVAITHTARGGPLLRMGDGSSKERKMATRTVIIDNVPLELEERDAPVIERRIAALEKEVSTAQAALGIAQTTLQTDSAKHATELTNATTALQAKDAENATLKQQLADAKMTPQKLDQMVGERTKVIARAKAIIGDSVAVEGKTDADIRKQVVLTKLGETAKDWTDDMITASFNTLTVTADSGFSNNGLHHVVEVIRGNEFGGGAENVAKAYDQYNTDISNRWKTAGVRNQA